MYPFWGSLIFSNHWFVSFISLEAYGFLIPLHMFLPNFLSSLSVTLIAHMLALSMMCHISYTLFYISLFFFSVSVCMFSFNLYIVHQSCLLVWPICVKHIHSVFNFRYCISQFYNVLFFYFQIILFLTYPYFYLLYYLFFSLPRYFLSLCIKRWRYIWWCYSPSFWV